MVQVVVLGAALVFAAMGGIVAWAVVHHQRRLAVFRNLAVKLGLAYTEKSRSSPLHPGLQFNFPWRVPRGVYLNILSGEQNGRDVRVCEFMYQVSSGKDNTTTVVLSIAHVHVRGAAWPRVTLEPETLGHKVADALGANDIDFESDEFSRTFWVRSKERRFTYDLIHPRMMEHLLEDGWPNWEIVDNVVSTWRRGRLKPEEAESILGRLHGFVDLVPKRLIGATEAPKTVPRPTFQEVQ